jgi:formate hydrogenlyase transcriptional activator
MEWWAMSAGMQHASGSAADRYEVLLRIAEALSACSEPEEMARALADQLNGVIHFEHLDVLALKENADEVEWHAWGKGALPLPDGRIEELPIWHLYNSQETLHIVDWDNDERFPRLKQWAATVSPSIGSVVRVPLTTPRRRLGTLGIASGPGSTYRAEDVGFLRQVARVTAFAIDDSLNLRRVEAARAELQRQNERLQLLLNLTNRITSNLELHELLRAVSANIREVMHCEGVAVYLADSASASFTILAFDFPQNKGTYKEGMQLSPPKNDPLRRAFDTLKPVIVSAIDPDVIHPEGYKIALAEGIKSHFFIPLANHGRALGVLGVAHTTKDVFTTEEVEFLSQASGQIAMALENALAYREISELKDKLAQEKLYLEEEIRCELNFDQIVGDSPAIKHVLQLVQTVAPSDSTVLLMGETGTGKELIARAIHDHSRRHQRAFVRLNCAAIPTGLLESELFGHEKGAFTGAISQKVGRLELADQGTLFLDEVGDVPREIQPKLLRVLQEREFERLGSTRTRRADVRLVAATNRDLERMIAEREFRSDLYYRLNVFPIRIQPLRERREDIALLARYFVQKCARQMQKQIETIPAAALKAMTEWHWPGNVRELANFIERAVILTRGKVLEVPVAELEKRVIHKPVGSLNAGGREEIVRIVREAISEMDSGAAKSAANEIDERQREEIERVLGETKGRVGGAEGAAARLGIKRTTLLFRMKKLGIDPKLFS